MTEIPSSMSHRQEGVCAFRHGLPALDEFPFDLWARMTARIWRGKPRGLLNYGEPAGYRPLREAISGYLSTSRGVKCHPDQVIVVSGSQQALDLAAGFYSTRETVSGSRTPVISAPAARFWRQAFGFIQCRLTARAFNCRASNTLKLRSVWLT